MDVGLSPGDFMLDGDPVPPPQKDGEAPNFQPMFIVSCRTRVKRLYAFAQIHYLCFSYYGIRVKYSVESHDVTDVICAKNRLQYVHRLTVTVTVTSFKNIVAYRRSALNLVWVIVMCIGEEI